ncbi:sensor histidine kinase [Saccharothrix syringae]|uniref:sensor histidine kinase n=1 Tax=Saccharothrix syringae TaxID=103733 RepID=UPI0012F84A7E|nr:histidine kinase [Saccharothrix syringae]
MESGIGEIVASGRGGSYRSPTRWTWAAAVAGAAAVGCSVVMAPVAYGPLALAVALAGPLPCHLVGVFAWWHVREHPVARRMVGASALFAVVIAFALAAPAVIGGPGSGHPLPRAVFGALMTTLVVLVVHLLALLPDGRYRFAHERFVLRPLWLLVPLDVLVALTDTRLPLGPVPVGMWVFLLGPVLLVVRCALLPAERRRELRWLLGLALLTAAVVAAPLVLSSLLPGRSGASVALVLVATVVVPGTLVLAALHRRMLDVDIEVRRSTRYRGLWLVIALWCVGLVVLLSLTASAYLPVGLAVPATIAATLLAEPLRARLTRAAALWVYGRRPTGQELLVRFGATLEQVFNPRALATELARSLHDALDLRWARVSLDTADQPTGTAGEVDDAPPELRVELRHRDDALGVIECGPRTEGRLTAADRELVETLARQAALAVHNIGLTAQLSDHLARIERQARELEASRARIIHAQHAERRRIQRHLHDGIQQDLVVTVTRLRLARNQLRRAPERADPLLGEVQEDVYRVIEALREVAHRIHPPELTDQGLAAAIRSRARRAPIPVAVHVGPELEIARFTPAVEESAYFLVSEALTNVLKHAEASRASIRLTRAADSLRVEVRDDGVGFPDGVLPTGLFDRADAVGGTLEVTGSPGGGATVQAELPAPEESGV